LKYKRGESDVKILPKGGPSKDDERFGQGKVSGATIIAMTRKWGQPSVRDFQVKHAHGLQLVSTTFRGKVKLGGGGNQLKQTPNGVLVRDWV